MTYAITLRDVSKIYRIGGHAGSLRGLYTRLTARGSQDADRTLHALDHVSFQIEPGEAVGLIGHNGAGKTTILKLLSKVTYPTAGFVDLRGRLSSLIQLGAGFHPELSGRDNIFLNGAILGLSISEIRKRFDEIVAFSELEQFIDTPVKRYSSGMYARLGFAVAVHVSPDVLLIDEVLAVGDTAFQYKCFRKLRELVEGGRTIIFVSHFMNAVQGLCPRTLWLDQGRLRLDGPSAEVIDAYLNHQHTQFLQTQDVRSPRPVREPLEITEVVLRNGEGVATREFASGEDIIVDLHYRTEETFRNPKFSVGVSDQGAGLLFLASMLLDGAQWGTLSGAGVVSCRFKGVSLMPKAYQVWGEVRGEEGLVYLAGWQPLGAFRVVTPPPQLAQRNGHMDISHLKDDAPLYVPHEWNLQPEQAVTPRLKEEVRR